MRPDISILLDRFGDGGVERVACHVANGMTRHGFAVEIVALRDAGPVRTLLNPDVSVQAIGGGQALGRADRIRDAIPALTAYLADRGPKIFHAPGNHTIRPAAKAVKKAQFAGAFVPKITNPIADKWMTKEQADSRRRSFRKALRRSRLILTLGKREVVHLASLDDKLAAIACPVHNPYVTPAMTPRAMKTDPRNPPIILAVGRLSPQKNHALLIRAAARLRHRPWRLRICGEGPLEGELRQLADRLGIGDRLDLPGFVEDLVPEYQSAAVTASSSKWEGLPATLVEAIACGCPVLATASSPILTDFLQSVGAAAPVRFTGSWGLARRIKACLEGRVPPIQPSSVAAFAVDAACDEHARIFEDVIQGKAPRSLG